MATTPAEAVRTTGTRQTLVPMEREAASVLKQEIYDVERRFVSGSSLSIEAVRETVYASAAGLAGRLISFRQPGLGSQLNRVARQAVIDYADALTLNKSFLDILQALKNSIDAAIQLTPQ